MPPRIKCGVIKIVYSRELEPKSHARLLLQIRNNRARWIRLRVLKSTTFLCRNAAIRNLNYSVKELIQKYNYHLH